MHATPLELTADFVGAHALSILLLLTAVLLLFTALLWRVIQRYAGRVSDWAARLWDRFQSALAPRVGRLRLRGAATQIGSIARRLGIQALLSIAVAVAAFTLFVEVADEIGVDEELAQFDEALSSSLQRHASRPLLQSFAVITRLGDATFLIALSCAVAMVLLFKRRWLLAGAWVIATAGGGILGRVLKASFERARPVHTHGIVAADGWSFPSGHASGSMIVYGLLGYLIFRHTPQQWHIPVALTAVTLVVFVGFSRVILQVHYLSDVLAGYAFAAAWVAMWIAGLETSQQRRRRDMYRAVV